MTEQKTLSFPDGLVEEITVAQSNFNTENNLNLNFSEFCIMLLKNDLGRNHQLGDVK